MIRVNQQMAVENSSNKILDCNNNQFTYGSRKIRAWV